MTTIRATGHGAGQAATTYRNPNRMICMRQPYASGYATTRAESAIRANSAPPGPTESITLRHRRHGCTWGR
jgi:hypothetical protein